MVLCSSLRTNLKFTTFFLWGLFLKCLQSLPTHSAINILFFSLSFSKLSKRLSEQTLISEYLSIAQEVHLLLTLTSFPDVETSKRKKIHLRTFSSVSLLETQLSSRAQCIYTWRAFKTLSWLTLLSLLSDAASLSSSVKYFCKDWCNISSDVLPKWKKWLLGMKACSQPEAEVCSYLDNLRKWLFSPLFFADHSVFG